MKKTLFLIGSFLLIQCGVAVLGLLIMMASSIVSGETINPNAQMSPAMMLLALLVANVLIIIASILIRGKGFKLPFRLGLPKGVLVKVTLLSMLAMVPLMYLVNIMTELLDLPDIMKDQFEAMSLSPWAIWVIALIAPVAEELCFRYGICESMLESRLKDKVKPNQWAWITIGVSAIVFAVIHMNPAQMLGAFAFGLFFGWLYMQTRSIWPVMLCHIFNNMLAVVIMRVFPSDTKLMDFTPEPWTLAGAIAGFAVVAVFCIWMLCRVLGKQLQAVEN